MQQFQEFLGGTSAILIIAIVGMMMLLLIALMSFQLRVKQLRLEEKRLSVEIEMMRHSFEAKIYDLNERMVQTPERWSDANHLLVESSKSQSIRGSNSDATGSHNQFLADLGIKPNDLHQKADKAFILTPFHEKFQKDYITIRGALNSVGYSVSRGDESFLEGNILRHIVTQISSSALIVANIDGRNPNVFYELGLAHALGKRVVVVTSSLDDVPFDLRNHLLIFWRNAEELERELTKSIARLRVSNGN